MGELNHGPVPLLDPASYLNKPSPCPFQHYIMSLKLPPHAGGDADGEVAAPVFRKIQIDRPPDIGGAHDLAFHDRELADIGIARADIGRIAAGYL